MLVLFAFALGGLFMLPLPLFLLQWKSFHVSIFAAAAVCMQSQAHICHSQKLQNTLACIDRTTAHRPAQTSTGHHLYNQAVYMLCPESQHIVAVIVIFQPMLTFRLLRSSSDSELLAESKLLLSRSLKSEDRSPSSPCTTGRVGIEGLPSAAAPAPPAVPGNLKFADKWFLHCFVR